MVKKKLLRRNIMSLLHLLRCHFTRVGVHYYIIICAL